MSSKQSPSPAQPKHKRSVNRRFPQEPSLSAEENSPPAKKTFMETKEDPAHLFKEPIADGSREINGLFAELADNLCEKVATDTSKTQELEGILKEARNLEAHLMEKKKHLRQTLALISDKLFGNEVYEG